MHRPVAIGSDPVRVAIMFSAASLKEPRGQAEQAIVWEENRDKDDDSGEEGDEDKDSELPRVSYNARGV